MFWASSPRTYPIQRIWNDLNPCSALIVISQIDSSSEYAQIGNNLRSRICLSRYDTLSVTKLVPHWLLAFFKAVKWHAAEWTYRIFWNLLILEIRLVIISSTQEFFTSNYSGHESNSIRKLEKLNQMFTTHFERKLQTIHRIRRHPWMLGVKSTG